MLCLGVVGVFEKQEVHVVFSFAFGAAIFHREPFATLRRPKRWWIWRGWVFRKGGFVLFGQGKSTPRLWESVRDLNVVGHKRLDIAPTTRSKRSISRHCFGRLLNIVFTPKRPACERTWSRSADDKDEWTRRSGSHALYWNSIPSYSTGPPCAVDWIAGRQYHNLVSRWRSRLESRSTRGLASLARHRFLARTTRPSLLAPG